MWATRQEDAKKLAKWEPIPTAPSAAPRGADRVSVAPGGSSEAAAEGANETLSPSGLAHVGGSAAAAEPGAADARNLGSGGSGGVSGQGSQGSLGQGSEGQGLDFFVPWHLPFHRIEASAAAAEARRRSEAGLGSESGVGVGRGAEGGKGFAGGEVDAAKGTVMFKRFYHLFDAGELEGLVGGIGGARLVDSFYDKSNWCVIFEKVHE